MLKDQKLINLEIDKPLYTPIFAKQADNARYLLFNLLSNGVPFTLTGRTVRAYATKPDGTKIYNDLIIVSATNGQAELKLTTQLLAVVGNVNMELVIYEGTDILSTTVFTLEVGATYRSDSAVISTNEFSALTTALANADSAKQAYIARASALETTYAPRLTGLEAKGFIPDNLLLGSDFEKTTGGFSGYTGTQVSLSTDYFYHGSQSLKMVATLANGGTLMTVSNEVLSLCKGKKVTFSFKARGVGASIGKEINAVIAWTGTGTYGTKVALTEAWQTIFVTTTLPVGATKMDLYMSVVSSVAGDIIYADYAKLELSDTVGIWKPNSEDILDSLLDKQTKTDSNLKTVDKTTTGAINEINSKIPNILYHGMHSTDRSILVAIRVLKNTEIMLKKETRNTIACVEYIKNNCMVHDAGLGSYFKAPSDGYYTFKGVACLSPETNTPSYTSTFLKIYNIDTTESHIIARSNLIGGMTEEFSFIITAYMLANQRIRFNVLNIAASSDTVTAGINQLTIIKETI